MHTLNNLDGFRPIRDRVIIRPDPGPATSKGGIIIPEAFRSQHGKEKGRKASWGTVVAVGPGAANNEGRFFEPEVVAGDHVLVTDGVPREEFRGPNGEPLYAIWHYAIIALDEDAAVRKSMRGETA